MIKIKAKVKVPANSDPGKSSLPGFQTDVLLLCLHMTYPLRAQGNTHAHTQEERERAHSGISSSFKGSTLMTSFYLNHIPKGLIYIYHHTEGRASTYEFLGCTVQPIRGPMWSICMNRCLPLPCGLQP